MPTQDRLAPAHRELLLVWAAREAGILDALATEAGTPSAVADAADVTDRAARIVVEALAEYGLLTQVEGEYEPTNRMLGFVTKTDIRSIGWLPHELDCLDRWLDLPETMETGRPGDLPEDWTRNQLGAEATQADATVRALVTEGVHAAPDADRVTVLADGAGKHAREFDRRGYDARLLDRPEVVEAVRPVLSETDVEATMGDPCEGIEDTDLVFAAGLSRWYDESKNRAWLEHAAEAVRPGGAVVCIDAVRGRSDSAPLLAAHMLAQSVTGDTYDEATYREWVADAGFDDVAVRDVPGTDVQAVVGREIQ